MVGEKISKASFKIVIRKVERPFSNDPFEEIDWIFQSFGFFERERSSTTATNTNSKTAYANAVNVSKNNKMHASKDHGPALIFKEILRRIEKPEFLTSTALANRLKISRGSLLNHLNTLQRSGLVVRQGRYYLPRSKSIERTIEEIQEDIERIFAKMKKTAQEIDQEMGIFEH